MKFVYFLHILFSTIFLSKNILSHYVKLGCVKKLDQRVKRIRENVEAKKPIQRGI